ncbi:HD domain-containing protein [Patescibacteria group bacterium]|nr:HD domain-containing protein [Patescibacteria group bacterium]
MTINDAIYGEEIIENAVILELIESPALQRLKKVSQFGLPDRYYHLDGYSRFDHSLGVMILLRRLGAGEEEQIAGLLHDASHTAFSHLVDWLHGDTENEDSQDRFHEERLNQTDIPQILSKYGYSVHRIADHHLFPLLEQDTPQLCADRIDYAMREFKPRIVKKLLPKIITHKQRIVFEDQTSARLFAEEFLRAQMEHWGGEEAVSRYKIFSSILRYALQHNWIKNDDLMRDDEHVLKLMDQYGDDRVQEILKLLSLRALPDLPLEQQATPKKFRHVDPEFIKEGVVVRLSNEDETFKTMLEKAKKINDLGIFSADPTKI